MLKRFIFIFLLFFPIAMSCADQSSAVAVIVGNTSVLEKLTKPEIIEIYSGKNVTITGNITPLPLDVNDPILRAYFYKSLIGMSLPRLNSYWARLMFSGQSTPPRILPNEMFVINMVKNNPSAIGFVWKKTADSSKSVKILIILQ